jgi:hypothetical protein
VHQLARVTTLIAVRRLWWPQARELAQVMRASTADTVESGIDSVSAISAPLMRSRRSAAIAATRSSQVLVEPPAGGYEDRSWR